MFVVFLKLSCFCSPNEPVQIDNVTYSDMEMYGDELSGDDRSPLVIQRGTRE